MFSGAKEGCSAAFKRAERSKDLNGWSRETGTWGGVGWGGVCRNRAVEEEKM